MGDIIKQMQIDGEIHPIGADAENVIYEGTQSVKEKIKSLSTGGVAATDAIIENSLTVNGYVVEGIGNEVILPSPRTIIFSQKDLGFSSVYEFSDGEYGFDEKPVVNGVEYNYLTAIFLTRAMDIDRVKDEIGMNQFNIGAITYTKDDTGEQTTIKGVLYYTEEYGHFRLLLFTNTNFQTEYNSNYTANSYTIYPDPSYVHMQGKFGSYDANYAHIVGGGTSKEDKKNIHTLDWDGNAIFAGDVTINYNNLLFKTIPEEVIVAGRNIQILSNMKENNIINQQNFNYKIKLPLTMEIYENGIPEKVLPKDIYCNNYYKLNLIIDENELNNLIGFKDDTQFYIYNNNDDLSSSSVINHLTITEIGTFLEKDCALLKTKYDADVNYLHKIFLDSPINYRGIDYNYGFSINNSLPVIKNSTGNYLGKADFSIDEGSPQTFDVFITNNYYISGNFGNIMIFLKDNNLKDIDINNLTQEYSYIYIEQVEVLNNGNKAFSLLQAITDLQSRIAALEAK